MEEIWKDIKGYEGCYQVSNLGRVKSLSRPIKRGKCIAFSAEKILSCAIDRRTGYRKCVLMKNNVIKRTYVHRLVAEAFVSNEGNKPCVDHIDADRTNNVFSNLRWVTYKENNNNPIYRTRNSFSRTGENNHLRRGIFGEENPTSIPVVQLNMDNTFIKRFWGAKAVQDELGYVSSYITRVCKGKSPAAYGFKWAYEEDYLKEIKN